MYTPRCAGSDCVHYLELYRWQVLVANLVLNATEILHTAVLLVPKDEGFVLPTFPAKTTRKMAETILEWSSDNKIAWQHFSDSLVAALSSCFQDHVQLECISKQREKMWASYHELICSQSFQTTWTTFLNSLGCNDTLCPVFNQFVTGSAMEQLIKLWYPVVSIESSDEEVSLDYQECKAVRYVAGYTIRALLKKVERFTKLNQKDELKNCLQEMAEGTDSSEDHSAD